VTDLFCPFSSDNERCIAKLKHTVKEMVLRGAQDWFQSTLMMSGGQKVVDSTPAADFFLSIFCEVIFSIGQHSKLPLDRE
jgi:hypothetical protein